MLYDLLSSALLWMCPLCCALTVSTVISSGCLLCVCVAVGGEPFQAFCRLGSGMVQAALAKVGWTARAEDSHTDKLLRATVIGLLTGRWEG